MSAGQGTEPEAVRPIVNMADAPEEVDALGARWGGSWRVLTPSMRPRGGSLGVCLMRLPPGHAAYPFHYHMKEDEVFIVQSGRGVLRYGERLHDVGPGDCISCPAGTGIAHQLANPHDEDLVYLAIGPHDPQEVCVYPDSGKVGVRGLGKVGVLEARAYMDGEPDVPRVFELLAQRGSAGA